MNGTGKEKIINILQIIEPEPEGEIGGADLHVLELAKEQKNNHGLKVVVFFNQNLQFKSMLEQENIEYIFFNKKVGFFNLIKFLVKWVNGNNINIIHSHGYDANYISYILKIFIKSNVKFVFTCHGWITSTLITFLKTLFDKKTYKIADAIIVVSPNMLSLQKKYFNKIIKFIPNSVYSRGGLVTKNLRTIFNIPSSNRIISYIGRLAPEKRVDLYLNVCSRIAKHFEDITFLVVGSGPEEKKMKELAESLGIQGKVIFTGLILDDQILNSIFHEMEFLVLSSDTEGTPRVILEAMSAAKPTISTRVGGIDKIIQHGINGLLVNKGDVQNIANYATELLNDKKTLFAFGKNALLSYETSFTMPKLANEVEAIYQSVLQNELNNDY